MRQCPRCASEITINDKVCPRCGLPVDKMKFDENSENQSSENLNEEVKLNKREAKRQKKLAKKEAKKQKKLRESRSDTDFSVYASDNYKKKPDDFVEDYKSKRKRLKEEQLRPKFDIDENGEFNIDTQDVEIVGAETAKLYEERQKQTYSVKKARGDYRPPKIKWWEIYKLADRSFAKRKIKREVAKASKIKPGFISKTKLLLLAIFFGWTGAHNFYAKNKKKGWVSLVSLILWVGVFYLGTVSKFFASIRLSVSGGAGFICLMIWLSDIINIIFNNFKYRIQKEKFIFSMNIETRAKLGEKYIDEDLYYKPWWVRFGVWCNKKKRNYDEWKHDRRQRMIQKEKEKLAKAEEKDKIESEIREYEEKEELKEKQKREEIKKQIAKDDLVGEIKKFEGESEDSNKKKNPPKAKKPKISVKGKKTKK